MKDMFSVLGYHENTVIQKYREKQYQKLHRIMKEHISEEIYASFLAFSEAKQKEFLFHPDQSSILLCLHFVENPQIYLKRFQEELEKFLSGNEGDMTMHSGYIIPGTTIRLTVQDNNPLNSYDAHPDSTSESGGKLGWGIQSPEEWIRVYENTFSLLKKIDKEFFSELNQMIPKIVAFGTARHKHYSASYRECVGTLYMGYTLDTDIPELHVLEGLIHESSHNKLNLILQFEAITLNDFSEKYYSPYRPDARHIYGVFLGIHALIPTVYVLLHGVKMGLVTDRKWLEKIALYHIKNKIGIATMKKHGLLSDMGKQVYQDLISVATASDVLVKEMIEQFQLPLPEIQKRAKEHFQEVNKNYPHLLY